MFSLETRERGKDLTAVFYCLKRGDREDGAKLAAKVQ